MYNLGLCACPYIILGGEDTPVCIDFPDTNVFLGQILSQAFIKAGIFMPSPQDAKIWHRSRAYFHGKLFDSNVFQITSKCYVVLGFLVADTGS